MKVDKRKASLKWFQRKDKKYGGEKGCNKISKTTSLINLLNCIFSWSVT